MNTCTQTGASQVTAPVARILQYTCSGFIRPIPAFIRYILYMPAIVASKHNPISRDFCTRLAQRNLPEMAIVAATMRKLLHLVFEVLKNDTPFNPNILKEKVLALDF